MKNKPLVSDAQDSSPTEGPPRDPSRPTDRGLNFSWIFKARVGRLFVLTICSIAALLGYGAHRQLPKAGPRTITAVSTLLILAALIGIGSAIIPNGRGRTWVGLSSILLTAAAVRLHLLSLSREVGLFPDAISYRDQAMRESLLKFWDGDTWTPFWLYCVRLAYRLFGSSVLIQRSLTVALSIMVVIGVFLLALKVSGTKSGLAASSFVAASPFLSWNSVQGLREEICSLQLILLMLLLTRSRDSSPKRWLTIGVLIGIIGLTRSEFVVAAGAVTTLTLLFQYREKLKKAGLVSLLAACLIVPQVLLIRAEHGTSSFWVEKFARWWVNLEYETGEISLEQYRISSNGQDPPSKEQLQRDFFSGPPISPLKWFFRVHSPKETFGRVAFSAATMPLYTFRATIWSGESTSLLASSGFRDQDPWVTMTWIFALLAMLGLLLVAIRGHWQPLVMVLSLAAIYGVPFTIGDFAYHRDAPWFDMRLSVPMVPLLATGLGGFVEEVAGLLKRAFTLMVSNAEEAA